MIQRDAQQLDRIIAEMNDGEKQALIDKLTRSIDGDHGDAADPNDLSSDKWKRRVDAWASGHPQNPNVDDNRESIYAGRG